MVINGRGQIGLYLCAIFPNRKFGTILDISLDQHHSVGFTEPFGRAVPGLFVHLHLFLPISSPVYVTLKAVTVGSGTRKKQKWKVTHDSNCYLTLINVGSGKNLDVNSAAIADGTNIQQYESNGSKAQK